MIKIYLRDFSAKVDANNFCNPNTLPDVPTLHPYDASISKYLDAKEKWITLNPQF